MRRLAAIALGALVAAGCGSSETSDPDRVEDVVREVMTTTDPGWCRELATARLLEQLQDRAGDDAVAECEQDTEFEEAARSVGISRVEVRDAAATAHAVVRGGDFDGSTYDLALVDRSGWRIDRITAVELDFEPYLRAARRYLTRPPDGYPPRRAACVIRVMRERGEEAMERAILEGDDEAFTAPSEACPA
jgi:hypothetical protein